MTVVQIAILGPVEVRRGDDVVAVPGARLQSLLARLALDAGRPVGIGTLVRTVWAEEQPQDEANALQSLVSRLRRALGSGASVVRQVAGGYQLAVEPDDVDALRFERLVVAGRSAQRTGDAARAAQTLREALSLWRGDIASVLPDSEGTRLTELRLAATGDRIAADLDLGRHGDLLPELERLVAEHPLREQLTDQLMTALARSGRTPEALAAYDRLRARLADELGIDPSAGLQQRQVDVLRGEVSAPTPPVPTQAGNLRTALTSFFGRDDEVAAVRTSLSRDRLVTVLGPGGAGKTRLASEAAAASTEAYGGDVWLIELAPVTDPAEVPHTVLAQLGHRDLQLLDARQPRIPREAVEQLLQVLSVRRCLLVLDNCEHLLDAVAELAETLLSRCPQLTVLTTSREPLGITGERLLPLPPLPMPPTGATAGAALESPAVRLFADRGAAAHPGFAVDDTTVAPVVEIVRRLDGLPLAIELAAARLRTLPVQEVAARLSDRFRLLTGGSRTALPRHRTLHAVVQWSWDLLDTEERSLVERLAVFPGGISTASAVSVVDGDVDAAELLSALVDKSLLQLVTVRDSRPGDGPRYRMLETIREFGIERLAERGELADVRMRHARHFAELVARTEPMLRDSRQVPALREVDREHDNALAALRTLIDHDEATAATQLAVNLCMYWMVQNRHAEAATWLAQVLEMRGDAPAELRLTARAAWGLNSMSAVESAALAAPAADPREALREIAEDLVTTSITSPIFLFMLAPILLFFLQDQERADTAMEIAVHHADPWVRASGHSFRARSAENAGDLATARADCAAALAGFEEIGDRWGAANILPLLAMLQMYDGDLDGAEKSLVEGQHIRQEFHAVDSEDELFSLLRLAELDARRGDGTQFERRAAQALAVAEDGRAPEMQAMALCMFARVELGLGRVSEAYVHRDRAAQLLADTHRTFWGTDHGDVMLASVSTAIALHEGDLADARALLQRGLTSARSSHDMPITAVIGTCVADYAARRGDQAAAARALGAAARLRGAEDPTQPDVARIAAAARAAIGAPAYERSWQSGWALDGAGAADLLDAVVDGQ